MTNTQTTTTKISHHYLRALLTVLAATILALSAFSVPAIGKQSDDPNQSVSGSNNRDVAVSLASSTATTPKASFASGSGENFLGVKVSDHGNLMSFESPQGQEATFNGQEGYAVCSGTTADTVHGHDTGSVEDGFGAPTLSQPTAGKFPLTVTRKTTDGKFQLKQVWNKPDPVEKDVTVTMTLKNLSSSTINGVYVSRSGDFDIGASSSDQGAATTDSAWQWDDRARASTEPTSGGVMLTALTLGTTNHGVFVESRSMWMGATRETCVHGSLTTPTPVQDLAMRGIYGLNAFNAGQSKTVKFEYGRM
jgi:hypothetical protein